MPVTLFEEFYKYVTPYVPACPAFVVSEHLAEAAARFCQETQCWRVPLPTSSTTADQAQYALAVPAETEVEAVIQLEVNGQRVSPVLETLEPQATLLDERGVPRGYTLVGGTTLQLYPTPDGAYPYRGLLAVKPTLAATGVESFIYQTWGRAIAYGAISTLKLVPGKSWTDAPMAAAYAGLFDKGVADCKRRTFRNTPLRVRAASFT